MNHHEQINPEYIQVSGLLLIVYTAAESTPDVVDVVIDFSPHP